LWKKLYVRDYGEIEELDEKEKDEKKLDWKTFYKKYM